MSPSCNESFFAELPYVFGGDGATVLVPSSRREAAESALRGIRRIAQEAFDMALRVGRVAVADLTAERQPVRVGRYRLSEHIVLAAFSGAGLSLAEQWIKDPERGPEFAVDADGPAEADLSGFECRWQPVQSRRGQVASLLFVAVGQTRAEREACYGRVLGRLEEVLGADHGRPVRRESMRLKRWGGNFTTEARLLTQQADGPAFRKKRRAIQRHTLGGRLLMTLGLSGGGFNPEQYLDEFMQNTDFRKFDEALRMVLDLEPAQIEAVKAFCDAEWGERQLAWGLHLSEAALVTCVVRSFQGDHLHFVDGADGGYALAARQLKQQLKQLEAERSG